MDKENVDSTEEFALVFTPSHDGAPKGLRRFFNGSSGEMLRGIRVFAWTWPKKNTEVGKGFREYASHWSTGPTETQQRLYTEADMLDALKRGDDAIAALQALKEESWLDIEGTESEYLAAAKDLANDVLEGEKTSRLKPLED